MKLQIFINQKQYLINHSSWGWVKSLWYLFYKTKNKMKYLTVSAKKVWGDLSFQLYREYGCPSQIHHLRLKPIFFNRKSFVLYIKKYLHSLWNQMHQSDIPSIKLLQSINMKIKELSFCKFIYISREMNCQYYRY